MELKEIFSAQPFPEYDDNTTRNITQKLENAKLVSNLEGGKFQLFENNQLYMLVRTADRELIGWAVVSVYDRIENILAIEMIYVRPTFRKTKAATLLLMGIKRALNVSLVVDGPTSPAGQRLLSNLDRTHLPVYWLNVDTGEKKQYNGEELPKYDRKGNRIVLLIEQDDTPLIYEDVIPGVLQRTIVLQFFNNDELKEML